VSNQVKAVEGDRYDLESSFFLLFASCLRDLDSDKGWRAMGANVLAEALCRAAHLAEPDEDAAMESLRFVPLGPGLSPFGEDDPLSFLDKSSKASPISDEWQGLGKLPVPTLEPVTLSRVGSGKWEVGYRDNCPVVNIIPEYSSNRTKHPKLSINIEGAPVCLLMRAHPDRRAKSDNDKDIKDAETLWKALLRWLSVQIGLAKPKGGRPGLDKGAKAAWLHDHHGLSWRDIARRLGGTKNPSREGIDNLRKQAEHYWKRLQQGVSRRLSTSK